MNSIIRAMAEGLCECGYMSLHDFLHLFGTPGPQYIEWSADGAAFFDPPVGVRESTYLMGLDPPKYPLPALAGDVEIESDHVAWCNETEGYVRVIWNNGDIEDLFLHVLM